MGELYPDDAALLAIGADEATGVEYIATGLSPYHVAFRRMLYRLLRAAERANDLRIYADGALSVGVRPGRCRVAGETIAFEGASGIAVSPGTVSWLWMDASGEVQTSEAGLPGDAWTHIALARVEAGAEQIEQVVDLRGWTMLLNPSLSHFGVEASAGEINQALAGIEGQVGALALNTLCGGPGVDADALHRHAQMIHEQAGEASFELMNTSNDSAANAAFRLVVPAHLPWGTRLGVNKANGYLEQQYGSEAAYNLVGSVHAQYRHEGELSGNVDDALAGMVPIGGVVSDVVLSVGGNIESSESNDGVMAIARVNGESLCTTDPAIRSGDGPGFRSTAQADGTAAVVRTDGVAEVSRGDVLSAELAYDALGQVSEPLRDVVVMVTVRADGPA